MLHTVFWKELGLIETIFNKKKGYFCFQYNDGPRNCFFLYYDVWILYDFENTYLCNEYYSYNVAFRCLFCTQLMQIYEIKNSRQSTELILAFCLVHFFHIFVIPLSEPYDTVLWMELFNCWMRYNTNSALHDFGLRPHEFGPIEFSKMYW